MLIYGLKPVIYYLKYYPADVHEVYLSKKEKAAEFEGEVETNAPISVPGTGFFQRQLEGVNHQGLAAKVTDFQYSNLQSVQFKNAPLVIILDGIQDPANLGAILRTAEAFGVDGVVIPKDRAASVTPAVIRASSGSARGVKVCREVNIARTIEFLKKNGFRIAAVDLEEGALPYYRFDMTVPLGLLFGSEGKGIRPLPRKRSDAIINIPMTGRVESLNVSASVAVIISEASRQRDAKKKLSD